jgi:tRNA pseudouridine55 synthase
MAENLENTTDSGQLILIDKPVGWTSFDVVKKLKYAGKFKKIGHAGTLDPLATGLLILCTGKMTKQIDSYQAQTKEYSGLFVLGKTTPSIDLETDFDQEYPIDHIDSALLENARNQLIGTIQQIPPIYSAVKQDGKRLYESARKGQEVEIKSREVTVNSFEIDDQNFPEIRFKIICSKGTYIRSMVRDFGVLCQSGAYLASLRREKIGDFNVNDALTLEKFIEKIKGELV